MSASMFKVTKPSSTRYLKVLIYGPYGAGKTTLAATSQDVPNMQNVLFVDAESGSLSLSHRQDIDVVRVTNFSQFSQVFEFLRLHCMYRDNKNAEALEALNTRVGVEADKTYQTVVIDSLTEVQKMVMYQLLSIEVGRARLDLVPDAPEYKEWGQSAEMIRLLVRSFRDLPMNVVFVCSEQEVEDERKRQLKRPNLPGKLSGEVQGFLDVVGYLATARKTEGDEVTILRRLYIQPTPTFAAKHRFSGVDLPYLDNPNMGELWQVQESSKNGKSGQPATTRSAQKKEQA